MLEARGQSADQPGERLGVHEAMLERDGEQPLAESVDLRGSLG
jgi:hypothetical protein